MLFPDIAMMLGLPMAPAYLSLDEATRAQTITGISYPSGGCGILKDIPDQYETLTNRKNSSILLFSLEMFFYIISCCFPYHNLNYDP